LTEYAFTIPGKPMPWQRAGASVRRGRPIFFTASATRAYQERVRMFATLAGVRPIIGHVEMEFRIYFPDNRVRDDDNVEKSIRDALQANKKANRPAIAFQNDNQVKHVDRRVMRPDPKNPRVEVVVRAMEAA
jgi:Holliday junction resolvase RusA-like endonuclease